MSYVGPWLRRAAHFGLVVCIAACGKTKTAAPGSGGEAGVAGDNSAGGAGAGAGGGTGGSGAGSGTGGSAGADACAFLGTVSTKLVCDEEECPTLTDRTYDVSLHFADAGYSDAELEVRVACTIQWLQDHGFEPMLGRNGTYVVVTATYAEVEEVLYDSVFDDVRVGCAEGDCSYCYELEPPSCGNDSLCHLVRGSPFNEALRCIDPPEDVMCAPFEISGECIDLPSFHRRDSDGKCWYFTITCEDIEGLPRDLTCENGELFDPPSCD